MQMMFIGAGLLILAAAAFVAVMVLARTALEKFDAHQVASHARKAEREITRREIAMRRYVMDDLKPARRVDA